MSDLLGQASDWLQAQRHTHLTTEVEYRRGVQSFALSATVGRSEFEIDNGSGVYLQTETRDYLLRAEDVPFGEPMPGDQVVDNGNVYEVMNRPGFPAWRFADLNRSTYRVHTKAVGGSL